MLLYILLFFNKIPVFDGDLIPRFIPTLLSAVILDTQHHKYMTDWPFF